MIGLFVCFADFWLFPWLQGESSGTFKGFKGFSLSGTASSGSALTAFSGFGNGGGFKGLGGLTNGNSIAPFGGFSSPAATSTATPGEDGAADLHLHLH